MQSGARCSTMHQVEPPGKKKKALLADIVPVNNAF